MQRIQFQWRAARGHRALATLRAIETSISTLNDEDLLDLQDIFSGSSPTPLGTMALAEMARRNLTA